MYIERDVRQVQNIKDISAFEVFLQILAGRAGNILNAADLAANSGISHATCKAWLSILENSRIIYLLRPWFRNISKRLIKSPKIYFTDTGLLAYLLKYPDAESLLASPAMGAVFENMIVMEFLKKKMNMRLNSDLYFYRDSNGVEVDLVIDEGLSMSLYEIKASKTLRSDMTKSLKLFNPTGSSVLSTTGRPVNIKKILLSFHENRLPLDGNVTALPWWEGGMTPHSHQQRIPPRTNSRCVGSIPNRRIKAHRACPENIHPPCCIIDSRAVLSSSVTARGSPVNLAIIPQ